MVTFTVNSPSGAPGKDFVKSVLKIVRLFTEPIGVRALASASAQPVTGIAAWNFLPAALQLACASARSASASHSRAAPCAAVAFGSCARAKPATSHAAQITATDRCARLGKERIN